MMSHWGGGGGGGGGRLNKWTTYTIMPEELLQLSHSRVVQVTWLQTSLTQFVAMQLVTRKVALTH